MTSHSDLEVVYVLFTIIGKRFDPALVGVFTTEYEARAAEKKVVTHPNHTTAFVLELPLCREAEEYNEYWIATVAKKVVSSIVK